MKRKIDLVLSFLIYSLGLLGFLLSDIYVSENFNQTKIANWAFYKSTILILGTLVLLGYDQVLVRDPQLINRFYKKFILQATLIATISVTIISLINDYSISDGIHLFLAVLFVGVINFLASSSRANFKLWKAQFSSNFWKVLLFIVLILELFEPILLNFILVTGIVLILTLILKGFKTNQDTLNYNELSNRDARLLATSFLLTNLTLIFAIYGEQFLINLYGDTRASAHLFKYFAIFTPIALSLNGYLGFYFGPKIRRAKRMNIMHFKRFSLKIILFSVLITFISTSIGYLYLTMFSSIDVIYIDWILILTLSILCIVRGTYVATSVCLGIFSDNRELKSIAIYFWISTILYISGIFFILKITNGILAAQLIAVLSVLNWLFRLTISNLFTLKILKKIDA